MLTKKIVVALAEKELAFRLHYEETEMPFLLFEKKSEKDAAELPDVEIDLEKIRQYSEQNYCSASFSEYCCLRTAAGDRLLHYERMIFHGVALIYKGKGYILTAPSGTGKSTQYKNLHEIYGEECRIISGDKPAVRRMSESIYRIYPSPWNGKENWSGNETAELEAVIFLKQGKENLIERPPASEMVLPLMEQIYYSAPDPETVHKACGMIDGILRHIPVYRFINTGSRSSSEMLGDFLDREQGI